MKVLLIGGYPKGHNRPFHLATLSGKRLRKIVEEVHLDAEYLDLWTTEREERKGKIDQVTIAIIKHHINNGVICVALGKWVHKRLLLQGVITQCLPHPASRRQLDLVAHHLNHDQSDNRPSNIQTLCKRCHNEHHWIW